MLALSRLATALLIALAPLLAHAADTAVANTAVLVNEASHKGQSPEISLGPDGSVHLVWIDENTAPKEHAEHGHSHVAATNLFYARSTDGGTTYSAPLQLNAKDGDVWGFR